MKHKFLSMMVAACAAVFSFSGLTGCSGGGGGGSETSSYGYLTVKDFSSCKKGIRIAGSNWMEIRPVAPTSGVESNLVNMDVELTFGSSNSPIGAWATYRVKSYQSSGSINQSSGKVPHVAEMVISLDDVDDVSNEAFLSAIGLGQSGDNEGMLGDELVLTLTFAKSGNVASYFAKLSSGGAGDNAAGEGTVQTTDPVTTSFVVIKL